MSETTSNNVVSGWQPYLPPGRRGLMPWTGSKVWFWTLMALIITALTTIAWGVPYIESRLDRLSRARLLSAGVDASTLNLRWDYRNLTVNGELPANTDVEKLTTILRQGMGEDSSFLAQGIRHLTIDVKPTSIVQNPLLPIPDETALSVAVRVENNTAILDGMVQTQEQRQSLLNALLESGTERISDNLDVLEYNSASNGGDAKVDALARMLAESGPDNATSVVATLDESNLSYRINANDSESAAAIEGVANIAMVDFQVDGYTSTAGAAATAVDVSAISDGATLTLSGQVFSDEQQRRLSFAANEAMGGASQVIDELQVIDQQALLVGTDDRIEELASILSRFTPAVSGEVQMRGLDVSVRAAVESENAKARLQEVMASARTSGLNVDENISIAGQSALDDVTELQQSLDKLAWQVQEYVVFNSGNSTLSTSSKDTLNLIASVVNSYPHLQVEVEGHTDNVGRDSINETLSRKRALAVKNYLVEQSVAQDRLVAVGYGHRMPVDTNDTLEGRKRNRRVHFNVVKQQSTN